MKEVYIIAGSGKTVSFCESLLRDQGVLASKTMTSGSELRRCLHDLEADLILINAPLPDESGPALAIETAEKTDCSVIMLVRSEIADEIAEQTLESGVIVVSKPVSRQAFHQAFQMAGIIRIRVEKLRRENEKLRAKIAELRLVDQAKCCLIEVLHMNEQQAHRYIEKHAMDARTTRGRIAEEILEKYKIE